MKHYDRAGNPISMAQWFWLCAGGSPFAGPDHRPQAEPPGPEAAETQVWRWELSNLSAMMHDFPAHPELGEKYKSVACDRIAGWEVSTVWTGVAIGDHVPPLIFETMVFGPRDDDRPGDSVVDAGPETAVWPTRAPMSDFECVRYPDEASALAGHREIVAAFSKWAAQAN